jgi:hypothetical protein
VTRARVGCTEPRYRMGSVGRLRELSESTIRGGLYCHWSEAQKTGEAIRVQRKQGYGR